LALTIDIYKKSGTYATKSAKTQVAAHNLSITTLSRIVHLFGVLMKLLYALLRGGQGHYL
jgi:hypothetical protein